MKKLILGSSSPRRKEILEYFSLPFLQIPSTFDEDAIPFHEDPKKYVLLLAEQKAELLNKQYPENLIVTADTIVFFQNKIYNKPKDEKDAFQMLQALSGKYHQVFTALCLWEKEKKVSDVEETKVLLNPLSKKEIDAFLRTHLFRDKAGAYAVQKTGSILVQKIEGCFYNTMGFPINTFRRLLLQMGIDLWDYLPK